MKGLLGLAFRNLSRQKRRNFTTLVAVSFGFAGLLLVAGYAYRIENYLRVYTLYLARIGHLTIMREKGLDRFLLKPKQYGLNIQEQGKIEKILAEIPAIEFFGKQLKGTGLIGNGCNTIPFAATGIEPKIAEKLRQHHELKKWTSEPLLVSLTQGKTIHDYPPSLGAIEVSVGLAATLHKPFVYDHFSNPPLNLQSPIHVVNCQSTEMMQQLSSDSNVQLLAGAGAGLLSAVDGEIVGHFSTGFRETDDSGVLTSVDLLQKLYGVDYVSSYSLWLKDPTQLDRVSNEVSRQLRTLGTPVEIIPWTDERISQVYTGTLQFVFTLVAFIATLLACLVAFSLLNSITITVLERTREIGMLRSLGFTRTEIQRLFLYEAGFLMGCGLAAGGALGLATIKLIHISNLRFHAPGMVGDIQLLLVPHAAHVTSLAFALSILSLFITWLAIHQQSNRSIAELLMKHKS